VVLLADHLEWTIEELKGKNIDDHDDDKTKILQLEAPPVLSRVIPAYNEQDRIPIMLQESFEILNSVKGFQVLQTLQQVSGDKTKVDNGSILPWEGSLRVEWLIVNDGSTDGTCKAVRRTFQQLNTIINNKNTKTKKDKTVKHRWKFFSLTHNSGKGAVVRTGMNLATGSFHLMVDADGATEFGTGLETLVGEVLSAREAHPIDSTVSYTPAVIFGSRAHMQQKLQHNVRWYERF
jgi:dolichyl-phosphate beta-glucosyltransferase